MYLLDLITKRTWSGLENWLNNHSDIQTFTCFIIIYTLCNDLCLCSWSIITVTAELHHAAAFVITGFEYLWMCVITVQREGEPSEDAMEHERCVSQRERHISPTKRWNVIKLILNTFIGAADELTLVSKD